jgi:hypothetical protein
MLCKSSSRFTFSFPVYLVKPGAEDTVAAHRVGCTVSSVELMRDTAMDPMHELKRIGRQNPSPMAVLPVCGRALKIELFFQPPAIQDAFADDIPELAVGAQDHRRPAGKFRFGSRLALSDKAALRNLRYEVENNLTVGSDSA